MNNKGQVTDIAFILLTLVSIAITAVIGAFIYYQVGNALDDSNIQSVESEKAYDDFAVAWPLLDSGFVIIVFGLIMALLVSSFFIPTHPIFLVINVIGFLLLIFIGAVFSNVYGEIVDQDGFNTTVAQYPKMTFMMVKLPYIGAAIIFLSTIILYAKGRSEEFG